MKKDTLVQIKYDEYLPKETRTEITIPYYGAWNHRKDTMVFVQEDKEHNKSVSDKEKYSRFIILRVSQSSIEKETIVPAADGRKLVVLFRDFDTKVTKKEFDKFLKTTMVSLTKQQWKR